MTISAEELKNTATIAVIDGNSLMHRAFHAVQTPMSAPDGRSTNACFGFIGMLLKLIEEFSPNGIICAFDRGRPKWRMEVLEQYKAQRPPMDPSLKEQFPMIEKLLASMSIPVVAMEGWEGDDILGTFAARGEQEGKRILLVTGDKDAYQLASETTQIVTTKKGISDVVIYDPDAVVDRYGVTPEQVPDYLGLKGDSSDNIPGVPGIGEKTATKLLQEYGSLEGLYEHADSLTGKMGDNIRENEQAAFDSRKVATIHRDAPVDLSLDEVHFPSYTADAVREAFGELRFNTHLKRVLGLLAGDAAEVPSGADGEFFGEAGGNGEAVISPVFEDDDALPFIEAALTKRDTIAVYLETGEETSLFADERRLFCATENGVARIDGEAVGRTLAHLFEEGRLVALNMKRLIQEVCPPDTGKMALLDAVAIDSSHLFDLSVAAYLLDSNRRDYSVAALLDTYCSVLPPSDDKGAVDGVYAAAGTLALATPMRSALEKDGSLSLYKDIEAPLTGVLAAMERTGVDLDTSVLEKMAVTTDARLEELKSDIYRSAGEEFNIDSPKQLGVILFEKLELPVKKRTKTGYSTDASVLQSLADEHPLPARILEYRELAKMKSTYIDALPAMLGSDGRLHTSFNQTVTATGRLSSSNPNLQNIPVRTDFGRKIRYAFTPEEDAYVFVSADYSQIELRLLAHLSGDKGLIEAFSSGEDFHAETAARVFGVAPQDVTPQMRSRAKAVNFGIVYGQQAFGLGKSLHIGYKEAQEMIDRYYEAYPRVRIYLDETVEHAHECGYAVTMFGRKRHIAELSSHNAALKAFGERTAMNHPMQGSAADIIKLAMIEVARHMEQNDFGARLCLQVHDELDFECPADTAEALGAMCKEAMEGVVKLEVPLICDVSSGPTWADAH